MNVQEMRERMNQEIDNFEDGIINIKELEFNIGLCIDQYISEYQSKKPKTITIIKTIQNWNDPDYLKNSIR